MVNKLNQININTALFFFFFPTAFPPKSLPCLSLSLGTTNRIAPQLKGHGHAILVHFKNQKYVLTSINAQK